MYHLLGFKWPLLKTWNYSSLPYTSDNITLLSYNMPKLDKLQVVYGDDVVQRSEMVQVLTTYKCAWHVLVLQGSSDAWDPEQVQVLQDAFPFSQIHLHDYYYCTLVYDLSIQHKPDKDTPCLYLK
jgi:hypothetical protein